MMITTSFAIPKAGLDPTDQQPRRAVSRLARNVDENEHGNDGDMRP
jgi:hypothetical protein